MQGRARGKTWPYVLATSSTGTNVPIEDGEEDLCLWPIGCAFPRSATEISSVAGGFHRMTSTVNLPFAIVVSLGERQ